MTQSSAVAQTALDGRAVLARLPLQIGTTATWSVGRAALTLFPGLAILGGGIYLVTFVQSAGAGAEACSDAEQRATGW